MKSIVVVLCSVMMIMFTSCRTTSARSYSRTKSTSECDSRGLLNGLEPGGLFASTRIIYNQVHVSPGTIHPAMIEQDSSGSLGLYHTYVPNGSPDDVLDSMKELQKLALSVTAREPRLLNNNQAVVFEGMDSALNVFIVDGQKLLKATAMKINVPASSSVIIIVRGETIAFTAMKLDGTVSYDKLMFIMPDAIGVTVRGDKFGGTFVAPNANIHMDAKLDGSVFGTTIRAMLLNKSVMYKGCTFSKSQFK